MSDPVKAMIDNVKKNMRVTKVVATRAIKTPKSGDYFAGFSAGWDSVQDDVSGPGADLDVMTPASEIAQSGMTLPEARVAHTVIAMEAAIAALRAAMIEGALTEDEFDVRVARVKGKAAAQIRKMVGLEPGAAQKQLEKTP